MFQECREEWCCIERKKRELRLTRHFERQGNRQPSRWSVQERSFQSVSITPQDTWIDVAGVSRREIVECPNVGAALCDEREVRLRIIFRQRTIAEG
jgi:hypothetical protein